jgi:shikimate 5-dehydrogenase
MTGGLSAAASDIGAVNTVVRLADGTLYGDNTDWIGIAAPLRRRLASHALPPAGASPSSRPVALVVGAGGTARAACYAVVRLGFALLVYNRTFAKARALAEAFCGRAVRTLGPEEVVAGSVDVVISTVPAQARFRLPERLFAAASPTAASAWVGASDAPRASTGTGVEIAADGRPTSEPETIAPSPRIVFDVVYRPLVTPLLAQAAEHGCETISGFEMFVHQGARQFEIWTGQKAPHAAERAAREELESSCD